MSPRRSIPLALALFAVAVTAACSDDPAPSLGADATARDAAIDGGVDDAGALEDASTATDAGLTAAEVITEVCERVHGRICAGLVACTCPLEERGLDPETCTRTRADECIAGLAPRITPDLEAGRVTTSEAAITACTDAIDAMSAECRTARPDPLPAACALLFVEVAPIGQRCEVSGGGLLFCADGAGVCAPGEGEAATCTALPGGGGACLGELCAPGFACNGGTCVAPVAEDGTCSAPGVCADDLVCNTASFTCEAPGGASDPCVATDDCAIGLSCDGGSCAQGVAVGGECRSTEACGAHRACLRAPETRVCTDPVGLGDACELGSCAAPLVCGEGGLCVALPAEDAPCLLGACAAGLACEDLTQTCQPLPTEGETCFMGSTFCAAGLGCDFSSNTCQRGGGDGAECLLNPPEAYVCADGFGCDFGAGGSVCRPIAATGAACNTGRTCAPTDYCDGTTSVCTARRPAGSLCPSYDECAEGLVCERRRGGPATCFATPARDEACIDTCAEGLACAGAGGRCGPELCVIP